MFRMLDGPAGKLIGRINVERMPRLLIAVPTRITAHPLSQTVDGNVGHDRVLDSCLVLCDR